MEDRVFCKHSLALLQIECHSRSKAAEKKRNGGANRDPVWNFFREEIESNGVVVVRCRECRQLQASFKGQHFILSLESKAFGERTAFYEIWTIWD
uniref:BED-type domain-containing protein n=1 Tax=Ditylenchus dipsaci TaxID=166011 RepID=A0A915DRA6_9BILA